MVPAIDKETSRSLVLDIAAAQADIRRSEEPERILTVLADKSDGLRTQPSRAGRPIAWTNFAPI